MRCLCESGGVPTAAYINFSSEHAEDSKREARWQRLWATVLVVLLTCITLPLTSAMADTTASREKKCQQRCAVHASLALLVVGFAPFVAHTFFGCWTAMHLGAWSSYTSFGALGGFVLLDALPSTSRQQRVVAVVVASLFWMIGAACAAFALKPETSMALSGLFWGFAVVNCVAAYHLCQLVMRQSTSHVWLNARVNFLGRLVTGVAGLLLLLVLCWMCFRDPNWAWQHPYSPGSAATALLWLGVAVFRHARCGEQTMATPQEGVGV